MTLMGRGSLGLPRIEDEEIHGSGLLLGSLSRWRPHRFHELLGQSQALLL